MMIQKNPHDCQKLLKGQAWVGKSEQEIIGVIRNDPSGLKPFFKSNPHDTMQFVIAAKNQMVELLRHPANDAPMKD